MNQPTTLGIDFGGTSIKFGVVQDGRIISHGNVVSTRQDGEIEPLIRSIVDEILRLQQEYPALEAVGFGVPGIIDPVKKMRATIAPSSRTYDNFQLGVSSQRGV